MSILPSEENSDSAAIFPGQSVMAERSRVFDWASTALGPVSTWSQSLRTVVAIIMESRHPMFLFWGPELVQIFNDGYLPSFGTRGRDVAALGGTGQEYWAEIWDVIGPQLRQVMTTGEATWHEDHLVPIERNGQIEEVYWTYGYSPVRGDDGAIAGVLVVVQETTSRIHAVAALEKARLEAETGRERLTELFRQAPAFVAVLRGPEFIFELANASYYQLVGHREIIGKPLLEALPDLRGQGFDTLLETVLQTKKPFQGRELHAELQRVPGAPPEHVYVDFVYAPIIESDGSMSGIFVHGVDVTEKVQSRRDVETARAEAVAANRVKGEFLANMSHELRTPLNAIAGYAQLLELGVHGPITDAQREALHRIQRSEQHLLALVNDVLNLAKLEAGRIDYDMTEIALGEVIATVSPMVEPQITGKGLRYEVRVTDGLKVRADRDKLQQILLNLVSNAIKFTESGGSITIDIGARSDDTAPEGVVFVRVSDTGIGIPRDKQQSIFDPFVQVSRQLTSSSTGTGLGLSISRDLARGMGGELRVRSEPGRGSTFTLALPAA